MKRKFVHLLGWLLLPFTLAVAVVINLTTPYDDSDY